MALEWTGDLERIVNSAQRDATKMHVRLNSALLLRSMLKNSGPCRDVLMGIGLNLDIIESALSSIPLHPEPGQMPQQIYDRASMIAACTHSNEISSLQVLLAMIEQACMAQSLLRAINVDFVTLRSTLYAQTSEIPQFVQARSSSSVSMSAVAVQHKSMRTSTTTYIEPEPALSFGEEDFPKVICTHPRSLARNRLLTPEEIKRLSKSSTTPSSPMQRAINSQLHQAPNKTHFTEAPSYPSSKLGDFRNIETHSEDSLSRQSSTYRSTSSKEIQQATTLDLARRLMQKKSQTNEGDLEWQKKHPSEKASAETAQKTPMPHESTYANLDNIDACASSNTSTKSTNEPGRNHAGSKKNLTNTQLELDFDSPAKHKMLLDHAVSEKNKASAPSFDTAINASKNSKNSKSPSDEDFAGQFRNEKSAQVTSASQRFSGTKDSAQRSKKQISKIAGFSPFALDKLHFPALAQYGRNLLSEALAGRIDRVIERDAEIDQLIDVLNKRRSNNPILVGEAGVGKTAIIEGLAVKMAHHEAPAPLEGKTIIALDYGAILSGTQLRGAVQERIRTIKSEIKKTNGRIILFLDEITSWISSNSNDPNADAALEIKLALSRGEIMCIGTATPQELRRAFNADPAFERRFDFIEVKEPTPENTVRIIENGIIEQYAKHHNVQYAKDAIDEAVRLSERYIQERALPDKAISILDRAGSLCERSGEKRVTREHVARIVSLIAEIPVQRLLMTERQKLLNMEAILGERLIGHERNIHKIADVIRRNHAGFGAHRPIGSFLFLGPTGVGKTEAAKVLAEYLFGSQKNIVRFDMSEFMEQHSVSKLIGAPAGYVGFDDGGLLTEALRKRPYQIVLFDEIEKAHPDIWNILLQILDEGRLTDAKGRHVDFSNTVIILTSNLGAQNLANAMQGAIGFANPESLSIQDAENIILKTAKSKFSPELWNRIEEKLVFHPLDLEQIERIAHLLLADSAKRLYKDKKITLSFDETAIIPFLIRNGGFDPSYGARPMRQTIQTQIESRVAEWIIAHEDCPKELFVGVRNDCVYVEEIAPLGLSVAHI